MPTALITGATSGIGRAAAEGLADAGFDVIVSGRDETRGREVVDAIEAAGGTARFVRADLGLEQDVAALAQEAAGVDVLVNNAGVFPFAPTHETDRQTLAEVFAANVFAPFALTAAAAPQMAGRGEGAVVNVSTMVADFGLSGLSAYSASKAALESLTRTWVAEYGPQGVRFNTVAPGPTRTPGTEVMGSALDDLASTTPMGRPASAQEIAAAIVFLATGASSYVNGVTLPVDGGRTAV